MFHCNNQHVNVTAKAITQSYAVTFVYVIEEFLKQLVHYFLSNNRLCNFSKTIALGSVNIIERSLEFVLEIIQIFANNCHC